MKQKNIFMNGEGDAWLERNKDRLGRIDSVSGVIEELSIKPISILEVGCANGWRLAKLREKYNCNIMGVEPSLQGCMEAGRLRVPAVQTTASSLPFSPGSFDLVIYGFCLYLTDPEDWFRIAAEGDQCLAEGGHLIIHDFGDHGSLAQWRRYEHRDGVRSYHFDFTRLWLAHPNYHVLRRVWTDDADMVTVLKKKNAIWEKK